MKISKTMASTINKQISAELSSAYLYLSMSAWFERENWRGCAHWMVKQANEEIAHAMKFFHFVVSRGGIVELEALPKPKSAWVTPKDVFTDAYEHELEVTKLINILVSKARKNEDTATELFLTWYVDEQVEEEDNTLEIVTTLEKVGDSKNGLVMLDRGLGKRE